MLQKVREAFDVPTFIREWCVEVEIDSNIIDDYIAICESKKILFMCDLIDFSATQDEIDFRIVEYNKILYALSNGRMYVAKV